MQYITIEEDGTLTRETGYGIIGFFLTPLFLGDEGLILSQVYPTTKNNDPISVITLAVPGYPSNATTIQIKFQVNVIFKKNLKQIIM